MFLISSIVKMVASPIFRLVASVITIIIYLVTVLSCYGGMIPPTWSAWGSVLTIGMPVMLTLSAVACVVWFVRGHWFMGGLGVLMFLLCINPIKMWFPMNGTQKQSPGTRTFTLLQWNILHGDDLGRPDYAGSRTMEEILRVDADIVCLQECTGFTQKSLRKYSKATVDSVLARYPYQLGEGSYDLRILSKYPLRHIYFGSVFNYRLADYVAVTLPGGTQVAVADIHLPSFALNEEEKGIFSKRGTAARKEDMAHRIVGKLKHAIPLRATAAEKVRDGFKELAMPLIIVGDFNDVPASWTYRVFTRAGFRDAYCETNFLPTYTFYPNLFYFHLDQIFYRGDIAPLSVKRLDIRTSDHLPLLSTFEYHPRR